MHNFDQCCIICANIFVAGVALATKQEYVIDKVRGNNIIRGYLVVISQVLMILVQV